VACVLPVRWRAVRANPVENRNVLRLRMDGGRARRDASGPKESDIHVHEKRWSNLVTDARGRGGRKSSQL